jgi:hypothetical protein
MTVQFIESPFLRLFIQRQGYEKHTLERHGHLIRDKPEILLWILFLKFAYLAIVVY